MLISLESLGTFPVFTKNSKILILKLFTVKSLLLRSKIIKLMFATIYTCKSEIIILFH